MAKTRIEEILLLLKGKSLAKQKAYEATKATMLGIKSVLRGYEQNLEEQFRRSDPPLRMEYREYGIFEAHFSFGSDTLVFMMHTNVFDFGKGHPIHTSAYVKKDLYREFCGVIQIYNFLSESLRYNRESDMGRLVARIYVNKESHFFMEGNRPFNVRFADFDNLVVSEMHINNIIEQAMLFCLNLDLLLPAVDAVRTISVEQKNLSSYNSGFRQIIAPGFKPTGLKEKNVE